MYRTNVKIGLILVLLFSLILVGCTVNNTVPGDSTVILEADASGGDESGRVLIEHLVRLRSAGSSAGFWSVVAEPDPSVSLDDAVAALRDYLSGHGEYDTEFSSWDSLRPRDYWALAFSHLTDTFILITSGMRMAERDEEIRDMLLRWERRRDRSVGKKKG